MSDPQAHGRIAIDLVHADVRSRVLRACPAGHATVLECHPVRGGLDDPVPFPTLFWLACPHAIEAVSRLEHAGAVARYEARLAAEPEAAAAYAADHAAYADERLARLSREESEALAARGRLEALAARGIGGIADRRRVKCLHLHYAHHLARGSQVGRWIAADLGAFACPGPGPGDARA